MKRWSISVRSCTTIAALCIAAAGCTGDDDGDDDVADFDAAVVIDASVDVIDAAVDDTDAAVAPDAGVDPDGAPGNTAPTISDIADQTVAEDGALSLLAFTVADAETDAAALTVAATSSNEAVVANAALVLAGTGTDRSLSLTPVPNANGSAVITVTVSDGDLTATDTFAVTVTPVNDGPTISALLDTTGAEDTPVEIDFTVGDIDTPLDSLILSATSSSPDVVDAATGIVFTGTGAARTVTITPVADATGPTTIVVTVSDGALSAADGFVLTIGAVNDPPTVSDIADVTTAEDTPTAALAFTVGDPDTALVALSVTAESSDLNIVDAAGLDLDGTDAARTLTITPRPDAFGTTTITVRVSDGVSTVLDTFVVTVTPVNDAPTISNILNRSTPEDTATGDINFVVGDVDNAADTLVVTAESGDLAIVAAAGIALGGAGTARTINITPVADATGIVTITVTVSDGTLTAVDTFNVNVGVVNDPPTMSDIGDQTTLEDTPTGAIAFTVDDIDTGAAALTVSGTSSNQAVIANAGITFGGAGGARTVTVTPVANAFGTATITVDVEDGFDSVSDTFEVTVTSVNDVPTISVIADQATNEDTPLVAVGFTIGDVETPAGALTVTAVSSNTALVDPAGVVLGGADEARNVSLTPLLNQFGTTTITITVNDGTATAVETFDLVVAPVNDPPFIEEILAQTTPEDTALLGVGFAVSDIETPAAALTVSAVSDNPAVLAAGGISFGGGDVMRVINMNPVAGASGSTTVTVTVSDGTDTSDSAFVLTVTEINDAPTISAIANQTGTEDETLGPVAFTVSDEETAAGSLLVSATSSNPAVVQAAGITLGGAGGARNISLAPVANANGTTTITVTVSDGLASAVTTFDATFAPVNDRPTIVAIADQTTDEDVPTGLIFISIADVDNPAATLTITPDSSNTDLLAVPGGFTFGGGGSIRTVVLRSVLNANTPQDGTSTVTLTVSDGDLDASTEFEFTVNPVNDAPVITPVADVATNEDTPVGPIAVLISDVDDDVAGLVLTAGSDNKTLVANAGLNIGGAGAVRNITVTPQPNANTPQDGPVTITLNVSDGLLSTNEPFVVTVNPVNDAPTIAMAPTATTAEDTTSGAIAVTINDIDNDPTTLVLSGTSSNTAVALNTGINFGGAGTARTMTVTPVADANGDTNIQVTVSDGALTANDTLLLTVTPVNDPPTVSLAATATTAEDTATGAIAVTVNDIDDDPNSLTLSGTSSNAAVALNTGIAFSGTGTARTMIVTPVANGNGDTNIQVTVSDDDSATGTDTLVLTVTPVNDAPTITMAATASTLEDTPTGAIAITVNDIDNDPATLLLTGTSSNAAVALNTGIAFGGAGTGRTMVVTPVANGNGDTNIVVEVSDGGLQANDTLVLTVTPVNDPPTIVMAATASTNEDVAAGPITVTVNDIDDDPNSLVLTGTSSNTAVALNTGIGFSGTGTARTMTVTPVADANGTTNIQVTVRDDDLASANATLALTVDAVNDPPTITAIGDQTISEDGTTAALGFTIGDVDSPIGTLTVLGSSNRPALVINSAVVIAGAGASRTVTVSPVADANSTNAGGDATITLTVSDGADSTQGSFDLTVNAVNDPPTIVAIADQVTAEDTTTSSISVTVNDVDNDPATLGLSGVSSNPGLAPTANINFAGAGTARSMTVTPAPNANTATNGTANITVTVSDGALTAQDTFVLTVNAVNDPPVLASATLTPNPAFENDTLTCTPGAVTDPDGGAPTFAFAWTVNGGPVAGQTNSTLASSFFEDPNVVQCLVTPNDGTDNGAQVGSNTVTIQPVFPVDCLAVLNETPGSPSGEYTIDPDGPGTGNAPFVATCDMTTDGGGWTLVLNYVHAAQTNPLLDVRTTNLPRQVSTTLGDDEQANPVAWGHADNDLFALLATPGNAEVRFFSETSHTAEGATMHFKTFDAGCISYFGTGTGDCSGMTGGANTILLAGHAANLPGAIAEFFTNEGDFAMTEFPFWLGNTHHWGIRGLAGRWESDDFVDTVAEDPIGIVGDGFDTRHQVWVRSAAPIFTSCSAVLAAQPGAVDGVFSIDPDGAGGDAPFDAFCDMQNGGWTMLLSSTATDTQFGNGPFSEWSTTSTFGTTPTAFTNATFKSQAYTTLATNEIRLCFENSTKCHVFSHGLGMALFEFFDSGTTYTEYAFNSRGDTDVGADASRTAYLTALGFTMNTFPCYWLGINHDQSISAIGLLADGNGGCTSLSGTVPYHDDFAAGIGLQSCGDGTCENGGGPHPAGHTFNTTSHPNGNHGPWFVLGR